jgi:hypothetical protein
MAGGIPNHFTTAAGSSPAFDGAPVAPSDTVDLPDAARALFIGGAGNVTVDTLVSGQTLTFRSLSGGSILPVACRRVRSTDTTATYIIALF